MLRILLSAFTVLALVLGAQAQDTGKKLSQITFASSDKNEDGLVTLGEAGQLASNAFLSMDANDNSLVSRSEFLEWDWGYMYLAEQAGKVERYSAVKRVLFALRDRNGDGDSTIANTETLSPANPF